MPVNRRHPVEELLAACRAFPLPPRRAIMFEYIMLDGINDSAEDARLMARLLEGIRCKINLLPCNEAPGLGFRRPPRERTTAFQDILRSHGYAVFIRESRGSDISAACGQLAGKQHPLNAP
jgi:23S rRNA (adenine2503-C2)-methyltransferase